MPQEVASHTTSHTPVAGSNARSVPSWVTPFQPPNTSSSTRDRIPRRGAAAHRGRPVDGAGWRGEVPGRALGAAVAEIERPQVGVVRGPVVGPPAERVQHGGTGVDRTTRGEATGRPGQFVGGLTPGLNRRGADGDEGHERDEQAAR